MTSALDLVASLRLEDGRRWGEVATSWQWADMRALLCTDRDAPRRHYWLRPRGAAKTGDGAAAALALLITEAPERSRLYTYASDTDQAGLVLDSVGGFVERSKLGGLVEVGATGVTCRATGATLSIESSDSASAFGTRPFACFVDEAAQWPDTRGHARLWSAIVSALGKVQGARLLVMSSAGSPGHPAHKRWTVAETSAHWRTSLTPGPCPWWSSDEVAAAAEQLLPAEFRRLILCEWAESDDALASPDDVAACVGDYTVREPRRGTRYVMSLDIGTRRDASVLAIGHLDRLQRGRVVVVDRVTRWTGTRLRPVSLTEVEEVLLAQWRAYHRPRLSFDPYGAQQLSERLRKAGVTADEFTFTPASINRLARSLHGALRDRAVCLPNVPEVLDELSSVRLVESSTPGLVRLDHRSGEHDDVAVTVAMLCANLLDRPSFSLDLQVPTGDLQAPAVDRRAYKPPSEPAVPTVASGELRPVEEIAPGWVPSRSQTPKVPGTRHAVALKAEAPAPGFIVELFRPRPPWFDDAACRGIDAELFYPTRGASPVEAKRVCAECPVHVDCLEYALATEQKFGIWGGESERSRRLLRRKRRRAS